MLGLGLAAAGGRVLKRAQQFELIAITPWVPMALALRW